MRVVILCGGQCEDIEFYKSKILEDDYIIAVDSGYDHAVAMGTCPSLIMGDMDSITTIHNIEEIKFPTEKDQTDSHLALLHAISLNPTEIIMMCCLGKRTDHALANIFLLKLAWENGVETSIVSSENTITYQQGVRRYQGSGYISVLPLVKSVVTLRGLKYPLEKKVICPHEGLGISNEFIGETAYVDIEGEALIIVSEKG